MVKCTEIPERVSSRPRNNVYRKNDEVRRVTMGAVWDADTSLSTWLIDEKK
ncbi:hypothetical protein HYZ41_02725 [archaeon]|nr:hypothetical protein [archaeon]